MMFILGKTRSYAGFLLNARFSAHLTLLERALAIDICLSVCPSNACIVTKRNNHLSIYQHHTTEEFFYFLEAKFRGPEFRVSSRTSVLKTDTPYRKPKFDQ